MTATTKNDSNNEKSRDRNNGREKKKEIAITEEKKKGTAITEEKKEGTVKKLQQQKKSRNGNNQKGTATIKNKKKE